MEVNPVSLENLRRGGGRVYDYSGRDLVVAAIVEAILPELASDDEVRFQLNKVFDFEVTEEVRTALAEKKALQVYAAMISAIFKKLVEGEAVSINEFATFFVVPAPDGWEVGVIHGSTTMRVLLPSDVRALEVRTARVKGGSWSGQSLAPEYRFFGEYAEGVTHEYDAAARSWVPINGSVRILAGEDLGVFNEAIVTAVGSDGIEREYVSGGLSIHVAVTRWLVDSETSDDQDVICIPVADQGAALAVERGLMGGFILENLGKTIPMGVNEWDMVKSRVPNDDPAAAADESFWGMPAQNVLQAYPRLKGVVRDEAGGTWEVRAIGEDAFRAAFGYREENLKLIGAWPERVRNKGNAVRADFRPAFVEAMQPDAG